MALSHTILATLSSQAFSGYDLWKRFSDETSHYWKASQQQVYRELNKLEAQGAISPKIVSQENRPDKKLYRITAVGKEILTAWLAEPSEPMSVREDLMVKVLAGHLVAPEITIAELKRRHEIHTQKLAGYQKTEKESYANPSKLSLAEKYRYLTFRRGIRYEQQWVEWCEEAIALINSQQSTVNSKKVG